MTRLEIFEPGLQLDPTRTVRAGKSCDSTRTRSGRAERLASRLGSIATLDASIDSPASLDGQQTENRSFRPESSPLESSQSFFDPVEYQPHDDEMDNPLKELQEPSFSDSSYELPSPGLADAFDLPPDFEYDRVTPSIDDDVEQIADRGKKRNAEIVSPPNELEPSFSDSSYELPSPGPADTFDPPPDFEYERVTPSIDDENDVESVPLKRGKKRNATFISPPNGELLHPFLQWELDRASMDKHMPEYAKQEGFAVNRLSEHKGTVIRWRCMHAGKYNNHRNLSAEIGNDTSPITLCC
jgi:hypothetical protein